jgi:hypothetical protein
MTKILALILILGASASQAHAETKTQEPLAPPSLMDQVFVVETDDSDLDAGLDRISGHIDRGFASDEYVYESENHYGAGALERVKKFDNSY